MEQELIKKLDFTIPDFLRTIWASESAREYWEPKIHRISNNWNFVERLTLTQEMRRGILQSILPEQIPELQNWALQNNIPMVILGLEGASESYGNASRSYRPGERFSYRVYFGAEPERFLNAWKLEDDLAIGRMLGFPDCCTFFFKKWWKIEGWRDLTALTFDDPNQRNWMYNNVLLRHIGIRGVFHLPCSVNCKPSHEIGMRIMEIMKFGGYDRDVEWLKELLSMPMLWTSLHGIAMVTTPILKTIYASDPLPETRILHLASDYYPKEGASGNQFPFLNSQPLHFQRDFNGFHSWSSMQDAHKFILKNLPERLSGKVLDLGCGTGHLLKSIRKEHLGVEIYGVDTQPQRFVGFIQGDIYDFEWEGKYELVLMSVERLHEVDPEKAIDLLQAIQVHSRLLLLSTYNQWKHGFDHIYDKLFSVVSVGRDSVLGYEAKLLESKYGI